jgi:hypothetical protein
VRERGSSLMNGFTGHVICHVTLRFYYKLINIVSTPRRVFHASLNFSVLTAVSHIDVPEALLIGSVKAACLGEDL